LERLHSHLGGSPSFVFFLLCCVFVPNVYISFSPSHTLSLTVFTCSFLLRQQHSFSVSQTLPLPGETYALPIRLFP
jgi:hypothetical protein